ncbi:aminopeptidase [Candidatus Woesearchaeota archaeon]|nr:aminopeptidase [Candidatus Woesearchaeota archaeon]
MVDQRIEKVADILLESTKVKEGDYVVIEGEYTAIELIKVLYKKVLQKSAFPIPRIGDDQFHSIYFKYATDKILKTFPEIAYQEIKKIDCLINIRAPKNLKEMANVDPNKITNRSKLLEPIKIERLKKRWIIFDFPTPSFAQEAGMSLEEFEDFVYNACIQDWKKISKEQDKFVKIMESGKEVRIVGKDTDIKLKIDGRKFVKGDGSHNMPDGEIFTAPFEDETEGYIYFDFPTVYSGKEVSDVRFVFKKGRIVEVKAEKGEDFVKQVIKTDEGASKLGELGIGLNYNIKKGIKNILFDEKTGSSIHMAIGSAYKECGGVNESAVHWDFIKDMKNGKIFLDGKLVYENGKFL